MTRFRIKRIYDEPGTDDGFRVLVDRLWPRGVSKARAEIDLWDRDVAPSAELRTWWNHDPARAEEFAHRYRAELAASSAAIRLRDRTADQDTVTLLYAARDPQLNHALVLRDVLADR